MHGHRFTVAEKDGSPIPEAAQYQEDVGGIAPAERVSLEFEADADPRIYPVHCHKVDHITTGGRYPRGMTTAIVYVEAMETDEFADVMADADHEGRSSSLDVQRVRDHEETDQYEEAL